MPEKKMRNLTAEEMTIFIRCLLKGNTDFEINRGEWPEPTLRDAKAFLKERGLL